MFTVFSQCDRFFISDAADSRYIIHIVSVRFEVGVRPSTSDYVSKGTREGKFIFNSSLASLLVPRRSPG